MARLIHDHKADKAKKIIEELSGEEGELIRYYLYKKELYIEEQNKKIKEMMDVFNGISKYTNRGLVRLG